MTAAYIAIAVIIVAALSSIVITIVKNRKKDQQLRADRAEFVRNVGAREHVTGGDTTPNFGAFPSPKGNFRGRPYEYAVEFSRSGYDVLAFERAYTRPKGVNDKEVAYAAYVQVRIPACPSVWITPPKPFGAPPRSLHRMPDYGADLTVATADEHFTRSTLTPEAMAVARKYVSRTYQSIVLEDGIACLKLSDRLAGENTLNGADTLIDFVRRLPLPTGR